MTDERVMHLERRIETLQAEHQEHERRLEIVTLGVQSILAEVQKLAASLASHTTDETDQHRARMTLLTRVILSVGAFLVLLSAIYESITGASIPQAVSNMLKTSICL